MWTRLWSGTRLSLLIAVIAVVIDLAIGMSYGLISGYFGKKVDFLMQRFVEILNGIPQVVLVTLFALVLEPGISSIILALLVSGWIPMSRVARAQMRNRKVRNMYWLPIPWEPITVKQFLGRLFLMSWGRWLP